MKEFIVKKQVILHASPEKVWNALTHPEKTKEYFFGCRVFSDWKTGSPIVFKGRFLFFFPIEMKGRILEIVPGQLLKYELQNSGGKSRSIVTDQLITQNGQTTLLITDDVGGEEGAQKRYDRSQKGWDKVLKGLKRLVEQD